jgi:ELWxxDGT repeat protein
VTDGTAAGTFEIDLNKAEGSNPRNFCRVGNRIYFSAKHTNSDGTKSYGEELIVTDGTVVGTKMVLDFASGPSSSNPVGLTYINFEGKPNLFFFANSGPLGKEPYKMEVPLITSNKDIQVESNLFTLFPNPSNGVIHILTADNATGTTVELSDINGRVLYQSVLNNQDNTINPTLDNGLYFVKLRTTKGEYQVKKLLIMQ